MASDDFTDSDGTGLESHDANWTGIDATYVVTNLEINSNIVEHEGNWQISGCYYDGSAVDLSQIIAKAHDNGRKNVCVRAGSNQRGYALSLTTPVGGNWTDANITKNGAFLATIETSGTWSQASNHTLKVTASGTTTVTVEGFVDGVSQGTSDDSSSPLDSGHPGFWTSETNTTANSQYDDWTDGAAVGGNAPTGGLYGLLVGPMGGPIGGGTEMGQYLGNFLEDATVRFMFNTFTSDDPSASCTITNFINTDVHIHKDNGLVQRNNAAGITVSTDFDGITGSHMVEIDTSDNTVAGFFVTGSDYFVRIEGTTVDGATINAVVAQFSIENRFTEVDVTKWLGQACHAVTENGVPKVDLDQIGGVVQSQTDFKDFVDTGYDPATHKVAGVVLADTTTTNTDMRGTDSAALASVLGALNDVAAAGDPTDADTLVQYIKQLINVLIGTAGIGAFPAEAAPANAVSLAEVIRAIHVDVTGLNGDVMRGTDGANTTVPDAAGVAPTAVEIQAEMEENGASILDTLRDDLADGGRLDLILDAILAMLDDARGEPGDLALPVNPDAMTKLDYVYKFMRNKIETTATKIHVYNDAGDNKDHTSTISDDGTTFTRGEFGAGD